MRKSAMLMLQAALLAAGVWGFIIALGDSGRLAFAFAVAILAAGAFVAVDEYIISRRGGGDDA